jgi:hypothetical protein
MAFLILPASGTFATGLLKWEWLDPTGVLRNLTQATSPDLFVARGTRGLGSPPVELRLEKLPTTGGSIHRYTATQPLEIDLPIHIHGVSMASVLAATDTLRDWFDTGNERVRTPGYLRITRPQDDAVRQIACAYTGGLEGDLSEGGPNGALAVVSLVAPDPYWTDVDVTETVYLAANVGTPLGVINPGDFDAYPIWTIDGPASAIAITNTTTGKAFALTANGGLSLLVGDRLTIDTRPSSQRSTLPIMDTTGTSQFNRLSAGSALWWLAPGGNTFTIAATGTSVATAFTLQWLPRYRGVLR